MVVLFYAALFTFMYIFLGAYVVKMRRLHRVGLGVGHKFPALERAVRIHGNFAENVPLFLVLVTLIEMNGAPFWTLHALCIAMLIGRISHAVGIRHNAGVSPQRFVGMVLTWLSLLIAAVIALVLSI